MLAAVSMRGRGCRAQVGQCLSGSGLSGLSLLQAHTVSTAVLRVQREEYLAVPTINCPKGVFGRDWMI